jgi:hypothetical protein
MMYCYNIIFNLIKFKHDHNNSGDFLNTTLSSVFGMFCAWKIQSVGIMWIMIYENKWKKEKFNKKVFIILCTVNKRNVCYEKRTKYQIQVHHGNES